MFKGLDHLAIVVPDTEEALKTWRDKFGFKVIVSEAVNNNTTLLTHLDHSIGHRRHARAVENGLDDAPMTLPDFS